MSTNGTHPTPTTAWAGPKTHVVTLPSGNTARLRDKLPVYLLLRTGQFSPDLFKAFNEWQDGELNDPAAASELIDLIVTSMFVEPRVTKDGEDGTLKIDMIDEADVDYVLEGASGVVPDATFHGDADRADGGGSSEVVGDDSKPAARPRARKSRGATSGSAAR